MKSTAHLATKMCPRPQVGGFKAVLLHFYYMQTAQKVKPLMRKARKEGDMLEVPGKMPIGHRSRGGASECGRLFAMDEAVRRKGKESAPGAVRSPGDPT